MNARRVLARAVVVALVVAAVGIALSACEVRASKLRHLAYRQRDDAAWRVLDEELPGDLSEVELEMQRYRPSVVCDVA